MKKILHLAFLVLLLLTPGCLVANVNTKLFKDYTDPLREFTLSGQGKEKIVLIPITGVISTTPREGFITSAPSPVQEVTAQLDKASADPDVAAVVLEIDSPGGTVTASDIINAEVERFKKKTGDKVVAAMMDVAASGGYYIAAAADRIVAHPTTVTGSIGVIFLRPNISGLMKKIGANVEVTKSGSHKDMGSPFREPTEEENRLFQEIIDEYYGRFVSVVARGRKMDEAAVRRLADGRVYTGKQALETGLVDRIGYLSDAVEEARAAAGLPTEARVVVYRRTRYADDNWYNTATAENGVKEPKLIDLGLDRFLACPRTGFYYLWLPGS